MSWWTDFRDEAIHIGTAGMYDPKRARQQERDQRNAVNAQIKAYQDQTNLARQQLDEARAATQAEKRRVEEKQIRALRRNYRSQGAGMLGVGSSATDDMNSRLGG